MREGLAALLLGMMHACIHNTPGDGDQQAAGVYLDRKADIVGQLLSGAAGVFEALDVQQQHLWQAVDAQPLRGLCLLITLLALEALITLSSKIHCLCTAALHILCVMYILYVLRAWHALEVLHGVSLCILSLISQVAWYVF